MKDYYKVLGVEQSASQDQIKDAYRKLAHKHHPDKAGGNEQKFKEINEAYQILSNKEKRSQYDRFGQTFDGSSPFGGAQGGQNPFGFDFNFDANNFGGASDMSDIFDMFFEGLGVKKKRRAYQRGADLEYIQEISLEEAFSGIKKKIHYDSFEDCSKCGSKGYFEKEGVIKCSNCDGRGEIRETRNSFFGAFSQIKACSKCKGTGQIPNKICNECSGTGRIKKQKIADVSIAPGTADSQLIKIPGGGDAGERGADTGDLYVRIKVKPHHVFQRHGDDLLIKKELNLINVLIGKKVEIPTVSGEKLNVEIPTDFNLNEKLKIPNEGMPRFNNYGKGDLYVSFQLKTPKKISPKIKKLLEDITNEI
ncbi:MAG: DnaJ C-terminal domain-containing protein [Candidatus Pacebacteria bacterium]|nr:DnaJ C-terminal domain-containing protein [Candidatus Paceibacterota bacterium]